MKVTYDPKDDGLRILFSDAPIDRTTNAAGLLLDFDTNGQLVGLEVPHASQRMPNPRLVEFVESTSDDETASSP